ncbi:MAG TPA: DUF2169 domain-containing protein [Nannocystis sp.]|jgi:hypothetical protein
MSELENLTGFAATCLPSMLPDDRQLTLVVVSGRFVLPRPDGREAPRPCEEQGEVRLADEYAGEPDALLLLHEGQSAPTRSGTDLTMLGHAWAPGGKLATRSDVELQVGRCHKRALVFGDRVWCRTMAGVAPSRPAAFESIPLSYRRCFGGTPEQPSTSVAEAAEYNPVGLGLHESEREAIDRPVPNFEDPQSPLQRPTGRPRPAGFGPIARHWRPRRTYAGTYDQAWVEHRAPLWPRDLDERFFSAAPPGLFAVPHLQGGEPVRIAGMSPHGDHAFSLPRVRLRARFELADRSIRRDLVLDAVHFELDGSIFTMYWRTAIATDPLRVRAVVVRTLDLWEQER